LILETISAQEGSEGEAATLIATRNELLNERDITEMDREMLSERDITGRLAGLLSPS